jgi:hypothetical protein
MVRNFYISARVDGRKSPLSGGPRRKDGGFDLTIYQRHEGTIQHACDILARVVADGSLCLQIEPGSALSTVVEPNGTITITSKR